jgi:hypothetical protein
MGDLECETEKFGCVDSYVAKCMGWEFCTASKVLLIKLKVLLMWGKHRLCPLTAHGVSQERT